MLYQYFRPRLLVLVFGFFISSFTFSFSQSEIPTSVMEDNRVMEDLTYDRDINGWLYFKEGLVLSPGEFFVRYQDELGLTSNDEMRQVRHLPNLHGYDYYFYQQYHKGIKVEGGEYREKLQDRSLVLANGKLLERADMPVAPSISAQAASRIALKEMATIIFKKDELTDSPNLPKILTPKAVATVEPAGELLYTFTNYNDLQHPTDFRLAWKYRVSSKVSFDIRNVYIDAITREVIKEHSILRHDGPAQTFYNGTQTIDTRAVGGVRFTWADNGGRSIRTRLTGGAITEADVLFDNVNAGAQATYSTGSASDVWGAAFTDGSTAHYGICEAFDYFDDEHFHTSWNDANEAINVLAEANFQNAYFVPSNSGPDYIIFGEIGGAPLSSLAIAGHEYTHGVVNRTSALGFGGENDDLNESFADIFGCLSEEASAGGTDFIIGNADPAFVTAEIDRNMINPIATGHPDTYQGTNWDTGGQPHNNGQVQNRWFTLLALGGSKSGYYLSGIGTDDAADIAFLNMTTLMTNDNFMDSRNNAVDAARTLFGECSSEHIQTAKAWAAVGRGLALDFPSSAYIAGTTTPNKNSFAFYAIRKASCIDFTSWSLSPSSAGTIWSSNANDLNVVFNQTGSATIIYSGTYVSTGSALTIELEVDVQGSGGGFLVGQSENPTTSQLNDKTPYQGEATLDVYPNPSNSFTNVQLYIDQLPTENAFVDIINVSGKSLRTQNNLISGTNSVDISGLSPGLYILRVQSEVGDLIGQKRLIIE